MNQYNQVPHLTQDTIRESDKNWIKHHKQEPLWKTVGQDFPHNEFISIIIELHYRIDWQSEKKWEWPGNVTTNQRQNTDSHITTQN